MCTCTCYNTLCVHVHVIIHMCTCTCYNTYMYMYMLSCMGYCCILHYRYVVKVTTDCLVTIQLDTSKTDAFFKLEVWREL